MDEFAEVLTLVQTKKINPLPIVLVGKAFWSPLLDWFRHSLLEQKLISPGDLDLFCLVESPEEALDVILNYHREHGVGIQNHNI